MALTQSGSDDGTRRNETMPAHIDAISQVYAKSLYELAEQAGGQSKIAEVADELEQICELARGDKRFREFVHSPIIDAKARASSLQRILANRVTDLTLRFLLVLNQKGRLGHLESINTAYDQIVQEAVGRVEVDVYTPAPLGHEQLEIVRQRITAALGKEAVVHPYTDPTMIGGVKLRVGDQLIDGSIATRLRRMKSDLLGKGGANIRQQFDRYLQDGEGAAA